MFISTGLPSVGRPLRLSRPGSFSQATTPQSAPRQLSMRMMALPSSVRQSPVGSAASAVPLTIVVATRVTIARRMVPPFG